MTAAVAHVLPQASGIEHSLALRREGYTFIGRRCQALASDAFRARLLLRPVVCMRGPEAARLFYGGAPLTRRGGTPKSALHLLQDEGSVQTLDGERHRRRKSLFMTLAEEPALSALVSCFDDAFEAALDDWVRGGEVVLHSALALVLTRAAADFCGVPGDRNLTRDLFQMIESAGAIGPPNWLARLHRRQRERWAARVIERSRRAPGAGGLFRERPGHWLLLDLYGTNRHPDVWESAEAFRPERFVRSPWPETPLVAQGGGDWRTTHRCPGEYVTMAVMKRALQRLAALDDTVPAQDLSIDLSHMSARPASGLVISNVRRT